MLLILNIAGQQPPKNKRPKEQGDNRIKPTNKKAKPKIPKIKDRDSADAAPKSQSIMMQAMDNGRFQKPAATMSLMAGQTVELRCKGSKVEWKKGELFVPSPSYFDVVYLNPDRQAVVPCRVTVLSAKVTLHREFPAKEIPVNGTDIIYDMKRGFVYLQPHADHQGVVYCKAEAGDTSQISVKYQLLYVEVPSGPPSTTILASSNKVNGGDDISVLCTVLGEPDVEVEFRWIFPGQKDERPVTIQDTWRLINRGLGHTTRISQSVITIEDFETIDAGYYICTAQNLQGQTTVATTVEFS
ncbi:Pdgfrl [Phodopus roborovskii]|uniref:Platelet-derived growth factor receptor-like protein n=1 Tax=Phodopus roborovskii TaxID=109678 RepID=A0AAU9Z3K0_PHORO|nr:Pdgfrl [Phodopus roborovskii]